MTFWRWVAVVVVVALGAVYGLGRRLPERHRAVAEGIVQAPQARVWKLVDDTATQTQWRAHLLTISQLQGDARGRCWHEAHRSIGLSFCQVEEIPQSKLVVQTVDSPGLGGTWTYTLTPVGDNATRISIFEDGFVKSPVWRFLGHYVVGEQTNVRQFLTDLQAEAVRKQ